MALVQSKLSSGLQAMTGEGNFPATYAEAGRRWADAYGTYASDGRSPTNGIPALTGAVAKLASALAAAFAGGGNVAPAMQAAFVAFWGAPPVVFAGAFAGLVTIPGGGPNLAGVFQSNIAGRASAKQACDAIAAEIHGYTLTVIVTDATTPTPTVGPIH